MGSIIMLDKECLGTFKELYFGDIFDNFKDNSICYGYIEYDSEKKDVPVALLMSDFTKKSLVITWMYVAPEYRGQYIMYSMVNTLIENAIRTNIIDSIFTASTNEDVVNFLAVQFGFSVDASSTAGVMTSTIGALSDYSDVAKDNNPSVLLMDVDKELVNKLNQYLKANEDVTVGVLLPIKISDYSELSLAVVQDNEIKAILLLNDEKDNLIVSYAYVKEGFGPLFMNMVVALQKELSKYPADKKIIAAVINEKSEKLFSKLFSEYTYEKMYECEYFL